MAHAARDFAVTHPLRPALLAGVVSLVSYCSAVAFCYTVVAPWVPGERLVPIMAFTLVFLAAWTAIIILMIVRRPDAEEAVRVWSPLARFLVVFSQVPVLWMIWGVLLDLPKDAEKAELTIVTLLVAMVPVQIIATPENTASIRSCIVTVLGSTIALLALRDGHEEHLLAVYIFGFACLFFCLSGTVRRTVRDTVAARLASDAAAQELKRLLADVAAERDAKTRFISAASHDLGQPLQAASLFFDQALHARDTEARARAENGARRAFAAAEQLLGHMLNHLRLEADAVKPYLSGVTLSAMLARVAAQYAPAAEIAGMALRPLKSRHVVMLDPALIERALGNLINNAIQHSGGSRLLVFTRRHGHSARRIWVIDDGAGINRTDAKHIFEDYYQGMGSKAVVKGGFGLGLSSVKRIMILMGGEAGLEPRWRNGAAFYLQFPMNATPESLSFMARSRGKVLKGNA